MDMALMILLLQMLLPFQVQSENSFQPEQDTSFVQVYETFDELEEAILKPKDDKIYVVNFWATWCIPCIKELPYFEALGNEISDEELEIVLVSIDFKERLENKVIPFIEKNNIQSKVVLLNDSKANSWIDRIDESWSGAIPITLIIKGGDRFFYEQEFDSTEALKAIIEPILKP